MVITIALCKKIDNARVAFEGEAERLGLKTEDDVVELVKEFRREKAKGVE